VMPPAGGSSRATSKNNIYFVGFWRSSTSADDVF
jgi:hypothetical protein